jgi:hypothetical protein
MGETASVNVIARICKPSGPFVNFDEKGRSSKPYTTKNRERERVACLTHPLIPLESSKMAKGHPLWRGLLYRQHYNIHLCVLPMRHHQKRMGNVFLHLSGSATRIELLR